MLASCAQDILGLLDDKTLFAADEVSELWREAIIDGQLLQKRLKQKVCVTILFDNVTCQLILTWTVL